MLKKNIPNNIIPFKPKLKKPKTNCKLLPKKHKISKPEPEPVSECES